MIDLDKTIVKKLVVDRIREMILDVSLLPGQRVTQDEIAKQLGVSRMPVREALGLLESEGLIKNIPHHGAVVAEISPEGIREVMQIRCHLEGLASFEGVPYLTSENIAYLEKLVDETKELTSLDKYYQINWDFHFTIYRASKMERLCSIIKPLWAENQRYRRVFGAPVRAAYHEHLQILESCRRLDCDSVRDLVIRHIEKTAEVIIKEMATKRKIYPDPKQEN